MGWFITRLRRITEVISGESPWALRLGGGVITVLLVGGSVTSGMALEQLSRHQLWLWPLLLLGLASALAGRSLRLAVEQVLVPLRADPADLPLARQRLAWIVGRDVEGLPQQELLRAAAETASENAVDGLFAPLFWMLVGAMLWQVDPALPGPLALAWGFKAGSTLDSMLGYRRGRLRWLGTAGARLDDALTWLPCRVVALNLGQLGQSLRDGASDPSPNAGVSQAAYAHAVGVQLGGINQYNGQERSKPLLNQQAAEVTPQAVTQMLGLSRRMTLQWLGWSGAGLAVMTAIQ